MRHLGPFEPHRLHLDEMEYTTMPMVMKKLKDRFIDLRKAKAQKETAATK
jgi:fructose 1,6-bisphosphate aldolase/phosphatase